MSKTNRRNFLKTTAAAGAGVIIAKDLLANESPNEKIAYAAVGVGGKGTSDASEAANHGEVVAICDTNRNQLAAGLARFENAKAYEDYRVMFDEMGDKIDAFTVSTADHMHGIISARGMKMGKHVYTQKPMARTIYETRRLTEIAREKKVITQMGNQGSGGPTFRETVQMIRAGMLGDVSDVYLWTDRPVWPQGNPRPTEPRDIPEYLNWDLWLGVAPHRPYYPGQYDPFAWRGWWDFGTGALGDNACHSMNLPFRALGLTNPGWVQAKTSGHDHDYFPKWSLIEYFFPATDARPAVRFHWMDGGQRPANSRDLIGDERPGNFGCVIVGSRGRWFSREDYGDDQATFFGFSNDEVRAWKDKVTYPRCPGFFTEFANAIKANDPSLCSSSFPEQAGPLTEMVLMGNLAVWGAWKPEEEGPRVEWDVNSMSITNNPEDKARLESLVRPTFREGYEMF